MKLIAEDVRFVVGKAGTNGKPAAVVGWADVPSIGGGAEEPGIVGAPWQAAGARGGIAPVGRNPEAAENAGEESKVLQVCRFKPLHPGTAGVNGLSHVISIVWRSRSRLEGFGKAGGYD